MNYPVAGENELDIRGLCCALWRGKLWILGTGALFALMAWIYTLLVTPKWSTTAVTERPAVNMLAGFYAQRQFLDSFSVRTDDASPALSVSAVMDDAYQEFIVQLSAWDTRRDFWLKSDYFKARQSNHKREDAALLDKLIANIQFQPADAAKSINDTIRLTADTSHDANRLLREYVAFANQRAVTHLSEELDAAWAARVAQLSAQIKRQEMVATAIFDRQLHVTEQALLIAQKQGFEQSKTNTPSEQLPDSALFLLGRPLLQARLESLRASGPSYGIDYDRDRAMLTTLSTGPEKMTSFQAWRYLRTPEEPVTRDSPRRLLLMVMWGCVGALLGAGTALVRRARPNRVAKQWTE